MWSNKVNNSFLTTIIRNDFFQCRSTLEDVLNRFQVSSGLFAVNTSSKEKFTANLTNFYFFCESSEYSKFAKVFSLNILLQDKKIISSFKDSKLSLFWVFLQNSTTSFNLLKYFFQFIFYSFLLVHSLQLGIRDSVFGICHS